MNWFDAIENDFAEINLVAGDKRKAAEEPRDVLANNIRENIKLFDNPSYMPVVRGKQRKLTPMFTKVKEPDVFEVVLTYCHSKLELKPGKFAAQMPRHAVRPFLERMAVEVANNKVFDQVLLGIREKRSIAMANSKAKVAVEVAEEKSS